MKNALGLTFVLPLVVSSFLAGSWYSWKPAGITKPRDSPRILCYRDPMHPAYKSDKPGIAPDCGMQLEPVYEGITPDSPSSSSGVPAGAIQISPEKQQIIGLRIATVEKTSDTLSKIRVLGRIAPDETRIYRLNAATDGWIRQTYANTTGSLVRKDEVLAAFYSPEFLSAEQAYLFSLGALDRFQSSGKESADQLALTSVNIQQNIDALRNLGMSEIQLQEIKRTRQLTQNVSIYAPITGLVVMRNISPGQRFEKGVELYRIADLSHVWVLADTFQNDAPYLRYATRAIVRYQSKTFPARFSDVLPQFDPATRTLKVRLELDNSGYLLRPEMFVDVEFEARLPDGVTVPVDAVLDSGVRKTVFVDRGNGYFEPRPVETGWRADDKVQITNGLAPGDRIVASGNFLLDSETRMRAAPTPQTYPAIPEKSGQHLAQVGGTQFGGAR
jgi:membrane fusion protein, copper/silver efflux system